MNASELPKKSSGTIRVAVDAMGGDNAPTHEVQGALLALRSSLKNLEIILVGKSESIQSMLPTDITQGMYVVHAADVIGMADEPSTIIKSRKESSLYVGLQLLQEGHADAFVSAGNTGAVMATATMMCGRIPGVSRPTIGSFFPTSSGVPTLVVDVGANVDSKPRFLRDYAIMGSEYTRLMLGVPNPTVGLLNVGEEPEKGTEVIREAHGLLSSAPIYFVGNVEGRDILRGSVNVVVCDGFEGNIVLKFAESVLGFLKHRFAMYASKGLPQKLLIGMFRPILKTIFADMDYQEYGGVPLLGINGVVIIGHGSSSPIAIKNMILRAAEVVHHDVNGSIRNALEADAQKGTTE